MNYDFDAVIDRRGTCSRKWEMATLPDVPEDLIAMTVADMDLPTAQPIVEALRARIDRDCFGYTVYDTAEMQSAVEGWYARRFGWAASWDSSVFSPGLMAGILLLLRLMSEPGDGIIIQTPVYPQFAHKISANGRVAVPNPLIDNGGHFEMDFEDLERKFAGDDVRGMLLCSPHNPVGRVWTKDELSRVLEIAHRYGKWIISDEAHMDLTHPGRIHIPLLSMDGADPERIIVCTSPAKTFNLAGFTCANLFIPNDEIREAYLEQRDGALAIAHGDALMTVAVRAAYNEGEAWLDQVRAYLYDNYRYFKHFIETELPKLRVAASEGTYLAWVDFNAYGLSGSTLQTLMLKKARVIGNPGEAFGAEGAGWMRFNLACSRRTLEEALKRIRAALNDSVR